ncbi:MAG: hypothetical protein HY241_06135 [Actinobacteria bacterium]|nr:hypothetical protein [Actinomycetota bacterium]
MGWLEVIGWMGSALIVISLAQARVLRFRVLNLLGALLATGYNGWLSIWPFVAMNAVIAAIDAYWLVRLLRERHDADTYQVVELAANDRYLRYVMRLHLTDIRTFQPGVTWDPQAPGRSAFLVLRRDQTVGVVIVRDAGSGIGQVEIDYVTPQFRDFTPGEFVYRHGGVLAGCGFHRVVAPTDMPSAATYYPRVGFRREDGRWVREVAPATQPSTRG